MDLLGFARGPALAFALFAFVAGIAWRVCDVLRRPASVDRSAPRQGSAAAGALRAVVSRTWPYRTFRERSWPATVNAYGYHVGLAIVFFGFAPHIAFVDRLLGVAWPALPGWAFVLGVWLTFVGLIVALARRLASPVLRLLSGIGDYAAWAITMLPILTGMALVTRPLGSIYPLRPDDPTAVAVHLLSVELLLVVLPFGKLAHALLVFASRGVTGARFARRGAAF